MTRSSLSMGLLAAAFAPLALLAPAFAQVQFDALGKQHLPADNDNTAAVACCDVDGDGDQDLVFGNGGQNRLYLNDGSGTFTDATASRMPWDGDDTLAVACCDVDGDGDQDLVFGEGVLYLNLLRQLDAPFLLRPGRSYRLDAYARYGVPRLVDVALPLVSTATASIPLRPWGTFRLDPTQSVALTPLVIPQPAGVISVSMVVPNMPSLVGVSVYAQALLIQYPWAHLTNLTADVVVR